jgi:hypothetical protein
MTKPVVAAGAAAAAAEAETDINALLALLVRDALSPRLNVKKCRIILVPKILTPRALSWLILVSLECKYRKKILVYILRYLLLIIFLYPLTS